MKVKTIPRLGVFTRPIDQGTSGSGHHLLEMVKHLLELNKRFEIFFIHYEKNDKEIYRRARQIIIPRNPFRTGGKFILHLSMFSERKNPWTILRGFKRFLDYEGCGDFQLVLAGKGWDNEKVSRYAARLGIADRIIRPGYIPQEEAVELLNQARAFVFPSFAEGFGMPNIEAMACGCPVITSKVFAIPEIVGDAALIMDNPADSADLAAKLQQLEKDERLREELIKRGLKRVGMFSWEESARKLLDVYESLIS